MTLQVAKNRVHWKSVILAWVRQNENIGKIMHTTYHIKPSEVNDSLMKTIRDLFENEEELTITVSSETKPQQALSLEDEKEKLFYSLFGSWQGEESGDELVSQIYSARVSNTRDVEL